jgi:RNA polymerase sigma-70 factor (ECF subfamily)
MPFGELSDEELLTISRNGPGSEREAAANELFSRHYERVARWCLRFTGDREAAADLAQDVFLKAHRHLASFEGSSRFTTWLYTIVRHESLNRLQRAAPPMQDEEVLAAVATLDAGPDELAEREHRGGRVREFLSATLDQTERTVFTLHYGDEMTLDAVTRLLGLDNVSGAKAYIVSAKRKLAKAAKRLRARGEEL